MRLIVVDDDRLVVDSLKIILGAQPQIEVVGTGANGKVTHNFFRKLTTA